MKSTVIDILYEDSHFIAIHKPGGLLAHPSKIDRHEKQSVVGILSDQLGKKPLIVHRLDKGTAGVMVLAFNPQAAKAIADLFMEKTVKKTYIAVVRGYPPLQDSIKTPLSDVEDKILRKPPKKKSQRKPAQTDYRCLTRIQIPVPISRYQTSRYSLLELHPITGRSHQLRRHLKSIRHPIIGDGRYGDHKHNRYFREELGLDGLMLAAVELDFIHPFTGQHVHLTAPIGGNLKRVIQHFRWTNTVPDRWLVPR